MSNDNISMCDVCLEGMEYGDELSVQARISYECDDDAVGTGNQVNLEVPKLGAREDGYERDVVALTAVLLCVSGHISAKFCSQDETLTEKAFIWDPESLVSWEQDALVACIKYIQDNPLHIDIHLGKGGFSDEVFDRVNALLYGSLHAKGFDDDKLSIGFFC